MRKPAIDVAECRAKKQISQASTQSDSLISKLPTEHTAKAQVDLSICLAYTRFVGFVMPWLIHPQVKLCT